MTTTEALRSEILRRLRELHPTSPLESLEQRATALVESGAYAYNGARIVPVGDRGALARAFAADARFVGSITTEHVTAASAGTTPDAAPYERARARLAAMGVTVDDAFESAEDPGEFMGVDLSNLPKGAA